MRVDGTLCELNVVKGLSRPIRLMALEWAPQITHTTIAWIDRLTTFAPAEFNIGLDKNPRLVSTRWIERPHLEEILSMFGDEKGFSADVYVRTIIDDPTPVSGIRCRGLF